MPRQVNHKLQGSFFFLNDKSGLSERIHPGGQTKRVSEQRLFSFFFDNMVLSVAVECREEEKPVCNYRVLDT